MPWRVVVACSIILLSGCGKKTESSPAPTQPVQDQTGAAKTPIAQDAAPAPTPLIDDQQQIATVLAELTQAVRKFGVEQQRVPKNLEELVSSGYLQRIPEAPTGKKFAIDKRLQVYLTKQ